MQAILSRFLPVCPQNHQALKVLFIVLSLLGLVLALLPSNNTAPFPHVDKLMHAAALFGFAFLLDIASLRSFWRWKVPILLGYGVFIEIAQSFTPWRSVSLGDVVADAAGILLYWLFWRLALQRYVPHLP